MKTRTIYIAMTVAGGLFMCSLSINAWFLWQIYGIGGWRDEVYTLLGATAAQQAMDDFRNGRLRLYVVGRENDRHRPTGTNDGPFQIWIPSFHPELGRAHRYSTEQFVEFYNQKMRYMYSHPERFLREMEPTGPKVEP